MVLLRPLIALIFLFGCKSGYLIEQGLGQLKLQNKARENDVVLKDPKVKKKYKEKIKKIAEYKRYFYEYWNKKPSKIYSKTTILDQKAVTYLVIASKFNEIKAKEECFPVMGCFPYLGFFEKKSADNYVEKLKKEGEYFTYTRPVYAYSTLGYFEDTILSSFFYYNDFDLAELIFHELFHTIFFVKDQVDLNENLANYFGKMMALEYFKDQPNLIEKNQKKLLDGRELSLHAVELIRKYSEDLQKSPPKNIEDSRTRLNEFLSSIFRPGMREKCKFLNKETCSMAENDWNNASFAAFLTYEKKGDKIKDLHKTLGGDLKKLYRFIEKRYQDFLDSDINKDEKDFSKYLFSSKI